MKSAALLGGAACVAAVNAAAIDSSLSNLPRALPANPSGYAPVTGPCPSTAPAVRVASALSPQESNWLKTRRNVTVQPMTEFLNRMNISGFNAGNYINTLKNNLTSLPNIGIALSGGGYRAMLNGAGAVEAFDSRVPNNTGAGQLGGLLQSANYLAGLSGGNWAVGSIYSNNFSTVYDLINANSGDLWDLEQDIFTGPNENHPVTGTLDYWHQLLDLTDDKKNAGFNLSLTDYWGRALSYQLVNASEGGPQYTWSSLAQQDFITNAQAPFPIIVSDSRQPGEILIPGNTTIMEFNPFEWGSWDPTLFGFSPMEYAGTAFSDGKPRDNNSCVTGFDNVGFIMGTSSTLFNEGLIELNGPDASKVPGFLRDAFNDTLKSLGEDGNDISVWPNPFYHFNEGNNLQANENYLSLVDGGEDDENIPLHPLIQPVRDLDVIFAVDSSADVNSWPNGTSLVATYERSLNSSLQNGTSFPYIPSQQTFVNLGLNNRPTFFGCNASNYTHNQDPGPLIVYLPNAPYVLQSNTSTFDLQYNASFRNAVALNGFNVATMGNATEDKQWPACVACAILSRSFDRTRTQYPEECTQCFNTYCWDGQLNNTQTPTYAPKTKLQTVNVQGGNKNAAPGIHAPSAGALVMAIAVAAFAFA